VVGRQVCNSAEMRLRRRRSSRQIILALPERPERPERHKLDHLAPHADWRRRSGSIELNRLRHGSASV
jgi:hypothetical protein